MFIATSHRAASDFCSSRARARGSADRTLFGSGWATALTLAKQCGAGISQLVGRPGQESEATHPRPLT